MAQFQRIRRLRRRPLRLGTTLVSNTAAGTLVNLDDPAVRRDLMNTDTNTYETVEQQADVLPGTSPTISNMAAAAAATDLTTPLATTKLRFTPIQLQAGDLISNLIFVAGATASGTLTASWAALFTIGTNLTAVAVSVNNAGAWAANTNRIFAMATPYLVPTNGTYLAAIATVATTPPTLIGSTTATAASFTSATVATSVWPQFAMNGSEATAVRTTTPLVLGAGTGTVAASDVTADVKVPLVQVT